MKLIARPCDNLIVMFKRLKISSKRGHDRAVRTPYAAATHVDQIRSFSALRSVGLWPPPGAKG
jgi:hypothetical protein